MATNLLGWTPWGGDPKKADALLKLGTPQAFNIHTPADQIPGVLFTRYFMPYAETNWPYEGANCNCEDLANALAATYEYVRRLRTNAKVATPLPAAVSQAKALDSDTGYITKPRLRAVGGVARGNVRGATTGGFDGRCYFPNHTFCKFGATFYDPTFNLVSARQDESVHARVTQSLGKLRICKSAGNNLLYACDDTRPAPSFSNSWIELNGDGWISAQAWGTETSRNIFHKRSADLQAVDKALKRFEDAGYSAFDSLVAAYKQWSSRNPHEAKARNKGGCVNGLAKFLGVAGVNYPNV